MSHRGFRLSLVVALSLALLWGCKETAKPKPRPPAPPRAKAPKGPRLPAGMKLYPEEVLLKGGSFVMGSPRDEKGRLSNEGPQHNVRITRVFTLWRHEVTQSEFRKIMGYNPSHFTECGGRCPVENVNWHEAAAFANRLSTSRGLSLCFRCTGRGKHSVCKAASGFSGRNYYNCSGYRLPTEAEWEYAARAGSSGMYYPPTGAKKGQLDSVLDRISWHATNSKASYKGAFACGRKIMKASHKDDKRKLRTRCGTQPVGQKQPNKWGLYDMLGNVSEWVYDRFGKYSSIGQRDPTGPLQGARLYRGCNWFQQGDQCRIARRFFGSPSIRNQTQGFRIARSIGVLAMKPKPRAKPKSR